MRSLSAHRAVAVMRLLLLSFSQSLPESLIREASVETARLFEDWKSELPVAG
jgi:hypothetical protein